MQFQPACAHCQKTIDEFVVQTHNGVRYTLCSFECVSKWVKIHGRYDGNILTVDNMLNKQLRNECNQCFEVKLLTYYWYMHKHNGLVYKFCHSGCFSNWNQDHSKYAEKV